MKDPEWECVEAELDEVRSYETYRLRVNGGHVYRTIVEPNRRGHYDRQPSMAMCFVPDPPKAKAKGRRKVKASPNAKAKPQRRVKIRVRRRKQTSGK